MTSETMLANITLASNDVANITMTAITMATSIVAKDNGINVGRMINIIGRPFWIIIGTVGKCFHLDFTSFFTYTKKMPKLHLLQTELSDQFEKCWHTGMYKIVRHSSILIWLETFLRIKGILSRPTL